MTTFTERWAMQRFRTFPKRSVSVLIATWVAVVAAVFAPVGSHAADGVSLEKKIKLINTMVEQGALTRSRADIMIKEAQRDAVVDGALRPHARSPDATAYGGDMREQIRREVMAEMKDQLVADIKRQVLAELTGAGGVSLPGSPATEASGGAATASEGSADKTKPRVVRVPYVPETMRREIREQLKQEVLTQAKAERWGNPDTLPEWLDRFTFEGDMRLRYDAVRLGKENTPAGPVYASVPLTRAADLVGPNGNPGIQNANTQDDFSRTRLRFRFGVTAKVADTVSAGFRISTGNTTGPTSTNQTLGQGLNKYALVLDRGYVALSPWTGLSLSGGRIANPFFSTDLVWADDLNFEGVAASYSRHLTTNLTGFATAGWFPLRTDSPLQTSARSLTGIQAGANWQFAPTSAFKFGAAVYNYKSVEGRLEDDARFVPTTASDYGTRYEYPNGLRQRGNTLFVTNALADPLAGTTYWGLASEFRELNLTGSLNIAKFDPVHVVLTGDYVKNLAFDRAKIAKRTGATFTDGKNYGYLGRVTVGYPAITRQGEWNTSLAYRWLGSDAVLDAYTNSDFGMGGTNNKGFILGGGYGIARNTWVSLRWMSSQLIDSMAPGSATPTKLSVDTFHIDLNAKF